MTAPQQKDLLTKRWRKPKVHGRLTPPESDLQIELVARVERCKVPGLLYLHIPNGLWTTERGGRRLRAMGLRPGFPDLLFALAGRVLVLELKAIDGELRDSQLLARQEVIGVGWGWAMRRDLESATTLLVECGFIRKGCA